MKVELENVKPKEIETRSFEIITRELGDKKLIPGTELIVKRCIHTSADLIMQIISAFQKGQWKKRSRRSRTEPVSVTDTQMAKAGINKKALKKYGGEVYCFMADEDVTQARKGTGLYQSHRLYG